IRSCLVTTLAAGQPVNDVLGDNSCGAPHRGGSRSQLFGFSGAAGDSISISLVSSAFDAYPVLDTSLTKPPVTENDTCVAGQKNACFRYLRLPRTATYTVEATTAGAGQTGAFRLSFARPAPPAPPSELDQINDKSWDPIPVGGTSTIGVILFQ